MEMRRQAGADLGLPDLGQFRHVAGLLNLDGLGWCVTDGMGNRQPLPWTEIVAFSAHAGLTAWERGVVRAMSVAYLEGLAIGEKPGARGPAEKDTSADQHAIARGIQAVFRLAAPMKG